MILESFFQTFFYFFIEVMLGVLFCLSFCAIKSATHRWLAFFAPFGGLTLLGMISPWAMNAASFLFYVGVMAGTFRLYRARSIAKVSGIAAEDLKISALLFTAMSAFWLFTLKDTASLPSRVDGINHLFFYTRMLQTGEIFTGRIPLLYGNFFGAQRMLFYPTGAHFLSAVILAPLRNSAHISQFLQLKIVLVAALSSVPTLMYLGCRRYVSSLPTFDRRAILWAAVLLATLAIFPFNPLGEGGFSRILGIVMSIPLTWVFLSPALLSTSSLVLAAVALPVLFFIHPEGIFLPAVAITLNVLRLSWITRDKKALLFQYFLAMFGCLIFIGLILKTAGQVVTQGSVLAFPSEFQQPTLHSVFERFKGPFHYLFGDSWGLGKFLSLRSLLAYTGIFLLFRKKYDFRFAWSGLLLLPFLLVGLVFIPLQLTKLVSVLFYHFPRRMVEMSFFPLFVVWVVALNLLFEKKQLSKGRRALIGLLAMITLLTSVTGLRAGYKMLRRLDQDFKTPTIAQINEVKRALSQLPSSENLKI